MAITRRKFLALSACTAALPTVGEWSARAVSMKQSSLAFDPRRPQFHLLPARNWMNDPNGPIYYNGQYHMFFQYNPESAVWGNMSWAHAVSSDMVHWRNLPVAFTMTPNGPDAAGCFSGSAIAVKEGGRNRVYVIYTGVVHDKQYETIRNEALRETQCIAWSDDPMLLHWKKAAKPILPAPPDGLQVTGFRDPSIWREGDSYLMTVGSGIEKQGGCVLLYRSSDLFHWEYLHPLIRGEWNGHPTSNPCDDGEMWECPDFFELDGGHVLIYSTMGKVFWQSGHFDKQALRFEAKRTGVLDLDAFYAPKTQLDAHGNRIVWGWIPERRNKEEMLAAGWSGMMSLPRQLQLDQDGELRITFAQETRSLRSKAIATKTRNGAANQSYVSLAAGEFTVAGAKQDSFEIIIRNGESEILTIRYSADEHVFMIGPEKLSFHATDMPAIHGFIDGSVVELLIAERIGYTKRFYYTGTAMPNVEIHVEGKGARLNAWAVTSISSNRMTNS